MKFDDNDSDPIRFTRSVSEYTRQMEELMASRNPKPYGIETYHQACEAIRNLREICWDTKRSKSERQPLFAKLRSLESFWGIDSIPYNGGNT